MNSKISELSKLLDQFVKSTPRTPQNNGSFQLSHPAAAGYSQILKRSRSKKAQSSLFASILPEGSETHILETTALQSKTAMAVSGVYAGRDLFWHTLYEIAEWVYLLILNVYYSLQCSSLKPLELKTGLICYSH